MCLLLLLVVSEVSGCTRSGARIDEGSGCGGPVPLSPKASMSEEELLSEIQVGNDDAVEELCSRYSTAGHGESCLPLYRKAAFAGGVRARRKYGILLLECGRSQSDRIEGLIWTLYSRGDTPLRETSRRLTLAKSLVGGNYGLPKLPELGRLILTEDKQWPGGEAYLNQTLESFAGRTPIQRERHCWP